MQRVLNPCPRVEHPIWLQRSINERASGRKQQSILNSFSAMRLKAIGASESASSNSMSGAAMPRLLTAGSGVGSGGSGCGSNSIVGSGGGGSANSNSIVGGGGVVKSILVHNDEGGAKPKKRVRIHLDGEVDDEPTQEQQQQSAAATIATAIGDLEDFGGVNSGAGTVSKTGVVKVSNFRPAGGADGSNAADVGSGEDAAVRADTEGEAEVEQQLTAAVAVIALNELPDGKHATSGDFSAWLSNRKTRWTALRAARRQQRKELQSISGGSGGSLVSSMGGGSAKRSVGVADFVRNASLAATLGFWQVRV